MCHQRVHLELWIDADSEPISGWMIREAGKRENFGGWVELTAAIESARQNQATCPAPRSAESR